ncbi:MAG: 4'-phosphopantetheinyl transferase superfamily protein [Wenzhouxiangella sp.]|nr:MAG: 4'-phosphopantetheinyl transferase superfamily protein [Wenzhouxiangella sp.]
MGWQAVSLPLRRRPLPPVGVIDFWLTDLDELPLEAGPSGLTRRERVLKRRIQQQFVLRLLLGSYLGRPGKDVIIARQDKGKPVLAPQLAASGLCFNLSHSAGWLAIAVARDLELGVDIETVRELKRPGDLAKRYFPAAEAEWLCGLEAAARSPAFLQQWTAREALVKAAGTGIAGALAEIELAWEPARIDKLPLDWPAPEQWSLLLPETPAGLIATLAAPRPEVELRCQFLRFEVKGER